MERWKVRGLLFGAAAIDVVFPVTVAVLDVVDAIDPMRRTLSLHALRPGLPWMPFAFLCHALALELLASGLRRLPPRPYAGPVMLRLAGGASALLAVFGADEPGSESTVGHLHEAFAMVAFLGLSAGALFAAYEHRRSPAWDGLRGLPTLAAFALIVTLAGLGVLVLVAQVYDPAHGYYGLAERIVVACIGLWMVAMAVQGGRLAGRLPTPDFPEPSLDSPD